MAGIEARIFNFGMQSKFCNEMEESKIIEQAINTANLEMSGGDPNYHVPTLYNLNSEKYRIQDQMAAAMNDLFGGDLSYIPKTISEKQTSISSRILATNDTAPNPQEGSCLRSGTLISVVNGTKVAIEELKPGDIIVGKNGAPCQVLGRNDILLGNRSLYGISQDKTAFFTSEHLFATQNDEWMCIDPDLFRLMNPQNSINQIHKMQDQNNILRWNGKTTDSDMPDLYAWPAVLICLASLTFAESTRQFQECFSTIDSLAERIRELSYQISTEWKKVMEMPTYCMNFNDIEKAIKLSVEKFKYLVDGNHNFLKEVLSKPTFIFLLQNLFILCGKDLHDFLNEHIQNDNDEFCCRATLLFRTADSLIKLYMKKLDYVNMLKKLIYCFDEFTVSSIIIIESNECGSHKFFIIEFYNQQ
ncbi:9302_t:CDS:2 [Dentiscutata erythropus]|uniref:9302_t:CDS:1 n=1 Tax=Dentiscutata erythropus TaxID=1348616 RepID=A0A9N9JNH0_9GLOM|nr:9302_t:CDS:2 [Dentiscutata erythropus]